VESIEDLQFEDPNGEFYATFEKEQVFYMYLPS
jgi:hypothetical protein